MIFISTLITAFSLIVFVTITAFFYVLSPENLKWVLSEAGPFEMGSALLFFVTAALGFYLFTKVRTKLSFSFSALMIIAAMRELDWHKKWTSDSILKSRFYLSEETPVIEKIFGIIFILTLIGAAIIVLKNIPKWLKLLKQKDMIAWGIFYAFGGLAIAKLIDSSNRLIPFILTKDESNHFQFLALEEGLEFIAACCFVMIAGLLIKRASH